MNTTSQSANTKIFVAAAIAAALLANPLAAAAATGSSFNYLGGKSTSEAVKQLQQQGYQLVHSDNQNDSISNYWWNSSRSECVIGHVEGWQYKHFENTTPQDCTRFSNQNSSSAVIGVIAGAAALAGVAALIHNKHKKEKQEEERRHQSDNDYYNNYYDYDDQYSNNRWNNRNNYHDNNHANGYRHHDDNQGYYVNVADLNGIRASYGESELINRGFRNVDGSKGWHRSYTSWWNPSARECVQVTTRDVRYSNVAVVQSGYCA